MCVRVSLCVRVCESVCVPVRMFAYMCVAYGSVTLVFQMLALAVFSVVLSIDH